MLDPLYRPRSYFEMLQGIIETQERLAKEDGTRPGEIATALMHASILAQDELDRWSTATAKRMLGGVHGAQPPTIEEIHRR